MREIKVKLWYSKQKVMSVPLSIWNLPDYDELEEQPIVLEFTGLKDNNGKEIYEEDIIEYNISSDFDEKSDLKFKHIVRYSELNHWWYFEFFKQKGIDGIKDFEGKGQTLGKYFRIEVIGNIYENKELLEMKK